MQLCKWPNGGISRRSGFKLAGALLFACYAQAQPDREGLSFPPRTQQALTGSQFADTVSRLESDERENAIVQQIVGGNVPPFLRRPIPVSLSGTTRTGAVVSATIFVLPEYLAIGSEDDFLRIPMNLYTARTIAERFGCVLPTRKMVDSIYAQSPFHFVPQPMPAGPQMRSTQYYRVHNGMIDEQSSTRGIPSGPMVSGHKKDVVMTNRLAANPGQIAIYGWHRGAGDPIQPLSTVHGAHYADYSHGIRLVKETAIVNGQTMSIHDVLRDSQLACALSDEGPMEPVLDLWARHPSARG